MPQGSSLEIRLLGTFEARFAGKVVPASLWQRRKAAAVVKLLALEAGHRLHREQLLETLWPELDPDSAGNNLRGTLHHARLGLERAGAPPGVFLVRDGDQLLLGPQERLVIDVEAFWEAANRAWQSTDLAAAEHAVGRYTGDLLPDDRYDDWAAARRDGLRASYLALLTRLARLHAERGEPAQAIACYDRILLTDPLDEAAHAGLMQLHAQMGNTSLALAQYARLTSLLDRELATSPQPETQALATEIRTGHLAPALPPAAPPRAAPHAEGIALSARLPVPVDTLLGRDQEVAELERLLGPARLVTLTGPGGIGKTRLAQAAARVCLTRFTDGVAFVDLAPLRDPALVLPTIARALSVDDTGSRPIGELLAASIGERRLLLVLDNFEHLTPAAPGVASLLQACPSLVVLNTSRVRLRLRGEHEYPVHPLALPEEHGRQTRLSLANLARVPAIALFAHRAAAARPSFTLTDENIDANVAICRRVDGLPLAIELAAAQVRVLTPAQLLQRLERPLAVLGTAAQDVPARQRTLRDTVAWSYDLLTPQEQGLFRRLSVFVGGWSLEGLEAVAYIDGDSRTFDAVETLSHLIDHSLIETRSGPDSAELRYSMLETIREYARERLANSGEAERVQRAFTAFLIALAMQAEAGMRGPEQVHWLDRLEAEHDNIRAALGTALDRGEGNLALQLAPRLWVFWWTHGYPREGQSWLQRTLASAPDGDPAARAAAEEGLGRYSIILGDYAAANQHLRRSLHLRRQLGDASAEASALNELALIAVNMNALAEAGNLGEQALQIARRTNDQRGIGTALRNLGMVAREQGDYTRAVELYSESLTLWRHLNDQRWIAIVASSLGITHRYEGNIDRALPMLNESQELFSRLGDRYMLGVVAHNLGHLAYAADDLDRALAHYLNALNHFSAIGAPEATVESIEWVAVAFAGKLLAAPALRLFAAATAARATLSLPPPTEADQRLVAAGLERAMQAAENNWQTPFAAGHALSLDEARDEAITQAEATLAASGQSQPTELPHELSDTRLGD